MAVRLQRSTRAEGDRDILRSQQSFSGGMNCDQAPNALPPGYLSDILNMRVSGGRLVALQAAVAQMPENLRITGGAEVAQQLGHVVQYGIGTSEKSPTAGGTFLWAVCSDSLSAQTRVRIRNPGTAWSIGVSGWAVSLDITDLVPFAEVASCRAKSFKDGILISCASAIVRVIVYEIASAYHLMALKVNVPAPYTNDIGPTEHSGANWTSDESGGEYLYQFAVTVGNKLPDGTIVWESLPMQFKTAEGVSRSIRLTGTSPIENWHTAFSITVDLSECQLGGTEPNFIRLWRTLNIYDLSVYSDSELLSVQSYRLETEETILPDGTFLFSYVSDTFKSDEILAAGGDILTLGASHSPIRCGGPLAIAPGFILSGDGHTWDYSKTGDSPEHCGYTFSGGPQSFTEGMDVTALVSTGSYILVATPGRIRRIGLSSVEDVAVAPGFYEPVFTDVSVVGDGIGIPAEYEGTVEAVGSQVIFLCADNHIRIFNGNSLNDPLDEGICSSILKDISGQSFGIYSPEGYYLLLWSSDGSGTNKGLRLDFSTSGAAASRCELGRIYQKPVFASKDLHVAINDSGLIGSWTGIICYQHSSTIVDHIGEIGDYVFSVFSQTDSVDDVLDLPCSATFVEFRGEYDGYLILHRESTLTTNGEFVSGSFSVIPSEEAMDTFGIRKAVPWSILLNGDQVKSPICSPRGSIGMRGCRIKVSASESIGFEICRIHSILSAMDRPYRMGSPVIDYAGDPSMTAYSAPIAGFFSTSSDSVLTDMEAENATFASLLLDIFDDGVSRTGRSISFSEGARLHGENVSIGDNGFTQFVGFWIKSFTPEHGAGTMLASFGEAWSFSAQQLVGGGIRIYAYNASGVAGSIGISASEISGSAWHLHIGMSRLSAVEFIAICINGGDPHYIYPSAKTGSKPEDVIVGGAFCTRNLEGIITPRIISSLVLHDLRMGIWNGSEAINPKRWIESYRATIGEELAGATEIRQ